MIRKISILFVSFTASLKPSYFPLEAITLAVGSRLKLRPPSANSSSVVDWTSGIKAIKLTVANGAADERLGTALALKSDGTTVVVGINQRLDNYQFPTRGAVYLYTKPVGGWVDSTRTDAFS